MSFASGPSERFQGPPGNDRYAYTGAYSGPNGGYQGDAANQSRPAPLAVQSYEGQYAPESGYGQRPPQSAPVPASYDGYQMAGGQSAHVAGQYTASHAYGTQPVQPQQAPHQFAYNAPNSATGAYAQPNMHQQPPPIVPSASAPVVAQYNHDPYAPPPMPPQTRAETYYQPPVSQQYQVPMSHQQQQPPQMSQQHPPQMAQQPPQMSQQHPPPPRHQQQQSMQAGQYYSQDNTGYYRHDPAHSPSPPQQYQQQPGPYSSNSGYVHSESSQTGSFYGSQGPPPVTSGPMRHPAQPMYHSQSPPPMAHAATHHLPPAHQSPPPQHQQLPGPARHSSLRHQPMHQSPVYAQHNSPQPQPLSQSQAQLQRHSSLNSHPGLAGSRPSMDKGGYGGQPPYRNSPTPVSLANNPPITDAYGGSAQVPGGLRRGQSMYDQQRDMLVQHPPRPHQQPHMAALVGSMGALSMARSSPQPQGGMFSQQTLVGSALMPAPYRAQTAQDMAAQNVRMAAQNVNMAAQNIAAQNMGSQSIAAQNMGSQNMGSQAMGPPGLASAATLPVSMSPMNKMAVAEMTGSTLSLAQTENSACPMWANINADGFSAYQHQVSVQQSNLSGTKYALIIGINYYELEYSQTSNINGAHAFKSLLMRKYGYAERNIVLLSDDQENVRNHPTHHNIASHVRRMMREVQPNDAVFFYYCGFGRLPSQLREKRSEVLANIRRLRSDYILPSDFEQAGAIDTEYLHRHLVRQLPPSARLTALFNCIVHETGLGVPYKYAHSNGVPVLTNAIAGSNLFEANMKLQAPNASYNDMSQRLESSLIQQQQQQAAGALARIQKSSGDIIVFGWARDYANPEYKKSLSQTPSNQLGNYWAAAMENAMRTHGASSFGDVLAYLHAHTRDLTMLPFIACGRKVSMDEKFII
ncbi:hypothetical protein GGH96_001900 [Coemansia sp. RSA 1972]|nr:hypothetical protein GGH96_001900 [Coemansia sp. RSA 1972]